MERYRGIEDVPSTRARRMHQYWLAKKDERAMPARADIDPSEIKDLLPRIGQYIRTFIDGFSNVVAEEDYTQEISSPRRKRHLKSDLMLVRYPSGQRCAKLS